jgi:hypothetical protein
MTDKQIIDGIDVKKCVYNESGYCTISKKAYCYCCDKPNCHYKNWQRKEQECEELKENLPNAITRLMGELDQLKAERDSYIDKYFLESQKVLKLNKVLKEIKEIAKKQCVCGVNCQDMEQILQKISEVEE